MTEDHPTLTDEDITTTPGSPVTPGREPTALGDADGTDGDAIDGTDGDAADGRDGDAEDSTDGDATDLTDGDASDADGEDA